MIARAFGLSVRLSNHLVSDPFAFLSLLRQVRDVHRKFYSTAGRLIGSLGLQEKRILTRERRLLLRTLNYKYQVGIWQGQEPKKRVRERQSDLLFY